MSVVMPYGPYDVSLPLLGPSDKSAPTDSRNSDGFLVHAVGTTGIRHKK